MRNRRNRYASPLEIIKAELQTFSKEIK